MCDALLLWLLLSWQVYTTFSFAHHNDNARVTAAAVVVVVVVVDCVWFLFFATFATFYCLLSHFSFVRFFFGAAHGDPCSRLIGISVRWTIIPMNQTDLTNHPESSGSAVVQDDTWGVGRVTGHWHGRCANELHIVVVLIVHVPSSCPSSPFVSSYY